LFLSFRLQRGGSRLSSQVRDVKPSDNPAGLLGQLEGVEGLEVEIGAPLSRYSTFRIGGPAEYLVRVHNQSALEALLSVAERLGMPFELLGLGSNVLFPDAGLSGIVARLNGELVRFQFHGTRVTAGGGMALAKLARLAAEKGLEGLEALAGFPSTVGGAVRMNAGSYGVEIKDVLVETTVLERDGRIRALTVRELQPSYRRTILRGSGGIVVSATFQLRDGSAEKALGRIEELNRRRRQSLPSGRPNVGSIFRNPEGDYAGRLIEACDLKGASCGDAQISLRHANVIVNNGSATAQDVLELMLSVRGAVQHRFGVELMPEVELMGSLRKRWREA
jgi:UDP-N-acetylmuramate dehydrogenase